MDLESWKKIFILFTSIIIIINWIPIISVYIPSKNETYYEMAILDENNGTQKYYPDETNTVQINKTMNWNIYLNNKMDKVEYTKIKIKFISSNTQEPNVLTKSPSTSEVKYEIDQILSKNQEKITNFSWKITEIINDGENSIIKMIINEKLTQITVLKSEVPNLIMILELWRFDTDQNNFIFTWTNASGTHCVWTQMKINMKDAAPVVQYLNSWIYPDGYPLPNGGEALTSKTLRLYSQITDAETTLGDLTVHISYKSQGGSETSISALYNSEGDYYYIDWPIPADATLGLYDVKVTASDGVNPEVHKDASGMFNINVPK